MEQILAEPAFLDLGLEIAVGRHDHACIERELGVSTDRAQGALLKYAKQLGLHLERHLADLVEQDRSGARLQEQTFARRLRIGERAGEVTEQLALEQGRRHRAAVDRDQRLVLARLRQPVQRTRDHLLAGPGLALDQHGGIGGGDAADHPLELADRARVPEHVLDRFGRGALLGQPLDLALQREVLERAIDRDLEHVGLHWLGQEIPCADAERGDRGIELSIAGQHDRGAVGIAAIELIAELDARHPRHLDIRDHHVDRIAPHVGEALGSRKHRIHREPAAAQGLAEQRGRVLLVIDDQHTGLRAGSRHF